MSERWIFFADGFPGGVDGVDGVDGSDGVGGSDGASGSDGAAGAAGSPVFSSAARISAGADASSGRGVFVTGTDPSASETFAAGSEPVFSKEVVSEEAILSRFISTSKKNADAIQNRADCHPGRRRKNPSICGRGRPSGKRDSAIGSRAETFFLKQFRTAICSAIRSASSR